MKKILWIGLTFLVLIVAGAWVLWQELGRPPEWATPPMAEEPQTPPHTSSAPESTAQVTPSPESAPTPLSAQRGAEATAPEPRLLSPAEQLRHTLKNKARQLEQKGMFQITESEVDLAIRAAFEKEFGHLKKPVLHQVQTRIQPQGILIQMVLDLNQIPEDRLPEQAQLLTGFLKKTNPAALQQFHVQLSGRPEIQNGQLQLDSSARIQMGRIEFPLNTFLESLLGTSQVELEAFQDLGTLDRLELKPGAIVVYGALQKSIQ